MPNSSEIPVTPGNGAKNAATFSIVEDSKTKELQRIVFSDSEGNEIGTADLPLYVYPAANLKSIIDSINAKLSTDAVTNGTVDLTPKFAPFTLSASGSVISAVTGKKIRVLSAMLSFSGSVNAKFQSGSGGTDLTKLFYGAANVNIPIPFSPIGHFETGIAAALYLNLSASVAVDGIITYIEV